MSRLIDADKLKEELNELRKSPWFNENVHGIIEQASYKAKNEALNIVEELVIDNAPTVDTTCPNCDSGYAQGYSDGYLKGKEERQQGEWIHPYITDIACECSNCHLQMPITDYFNFCPNCGAKMAKEAENE